MKKIYLCALALSVGATTFAQRVAEQSFAAKEFTSNNSQVLSPIKAKQNNNKAAGDVIWTEDFTGGFPAGWSKGGTTNAGADWIINALDLNPTTYPPSQYTNTAAIPSTSGGNHMLFFGENITPIADHDAYFQTNAIALTGQANVSVKFEQIFRLCCQSSAALDLVVSTDPTFPVGAQTQTFDARNGTDINAFNDYLLTTIDISSLVGGYTGNIYLRFHWNSGASHYFWMIDDITVFETQLNDLAGGTPHYGFNGNPYTRVPVAHAQPVQFKMTAENLGVAHQTAAVLNVDINNGFYTAAGVPQTVMVDSIDTLEAPAFTPTTVGVPYNVSLALTSDSVDYNTGNDSAFFAPFELTQFTYAYDNYTPSTNQGNVGGPAVAGGTDFEFEAGHFFDAVSTTNSWAKEIHVVTGSNTPAIGGAIDAVIYLVDLTVSPISYTELYRTPVYATTAGDVGNVHVFDLGTNAVALTTGQTYFVAIHTISEYSIASSGLSPNPTTDFGTPSYIYYPNMTAPVTSYYTTRTPMVRLVVTDQLGVNEINNNVKFSVAPNPTKDVVAINLNAETNENVTINVRNVVGQTVITKNVPVSGKTTETVSLANYGKGVYFVTVVNNNESKTVKVIVE